METETIRAANRQIDRSIGFGAAVRFEADGDALARLVDAAERPRTICTVDVDLLSTLVVSATVANVVRLLFAVERQAKAAAGRTQPPRSDTACSRHSRIRTAEGTTR